VYVDVRVTSLIPPRDGTDTGTYRNIHQSASVTRHNSDFPIGVADELPVYYRGGVGKSNRGPRREGVGNLRIALGGRAKIKPYFGTQWGAFAAL